MEYHSACTLSSGCPSFLVSCHLLNTTGLRHKYLPVPPIVTFKSDSVLWLRIDSRVTVKGQIQMFNALIFAYVIITLTDFFLPLSG